MHLKRPLCIAIALLLLLCCAVATAQQSAQAWQFTFFAGDPPIWHKSQEPYTTRAECEIARAEKTTAGYPVGECAALRTATPPKTSRASGDAGAATTTTPQQREVQTLRAEKLREGCLVGCDTTHQACVANLTTVEQCVQDQNARCIERCTSVENLPHHQCINEVCLPTDVNLASWQGLCETQTTNLASSCEASLTQCKVTCDTEHPLP